MSRPKRLPPLAPATRAALHRALEALPSWGSEPPPGVPTALGALKTADPLLASVVAIVHFFCYLETRRAKTGDKFIRRGLPAIVFQWVKIFRHASGAALAAGDVAFFQQVGELLGSLAPHNGKPRLDTYCWLATLGREPGRLCDIRDLVVSLIADVEGEPPRSVTSADVRDSLRRLGIPWK